MNRTDIVNNINTARKGAHDKARAYRNHKTNRYNYWRALTATGTYDDALTMFAKGTERKIPSMAAKAAADFERVRDSEDPEMILAVMDGHRDALLTVAEWMTTEESDR